MVCKRSESGVERAKGGRDWVPRLPCVIFRRSARAEVVERRDGSTGRGRGAGRDCVSESGDGTGISGDLTDSPIPPQRGPVCGSRMLPAFWERVSLK